MILGKFLPPHAGHKYLVDFAANYVDDLTVIVGSLAAEPIPGDLRCRWMGEMFPQARILHLTDENPQYPHEHPDFWQIWRDSIRRVYPAGPDYLFASETYGARLAEILGARFVPTDLTRSLIPVSGTQIRENPLVCWQYLPECVRPYFVKRVCIVGPESTGKSVLAKRLAKHFNTVHVSEYARDLIGLHDNRVTADLFPMIARGQIASEEALARQANRVLICDTDLITTLIWHDKLIGGKPSWLSDMADSRTYDLYLLMDIDAPWVDDPQRFLPNERQFFLETCKQELQSRNRPYVLIGGSWENRFQQACRRIEGLPGFARETTTPCFVE